MKSRPIPVRFFLVLLIFIAPCSRLTAQDAKVRASLSTNSVWVGERLTLVVELLAPGIFDNSPSFDLPDPLGLTLLPPTDRPLLQSEDIDGKSYTVQRHELSVFTRRGGEQTIPPLTIRVHFKRNPLDKNPVTESVKSEPLKFTAKIPPGAEKLGNLISARDLKAAQHWTPEPGITNVKAGDAFTRTITFSASDVPGMGFPPFPADQIDGVGVYSKPPQVMDKSERGEFSGERRDTITYVFERPGHFVIPAVQLKWWDLDEQKLRTIDFHQQAFDVLPNPSMTGGPAAQKSSFHLHTKTIVALVVALATLGYFLFLFRKALIKEFARFKPLHLKPLNPIRLSNSHH